MSELKPPFWHHVACNGSNNYPVGHPGMICNCKGWAIRGAQPCPTCAEKDAQIALIDKNRDLIVADYERDRRAASPSTQSHAPSAEPQRFCARCNARLLLATRDGRKYCVNCGTYRWGYQGAPSRSAPREAGAQRPTHTADGNEILGWTKPQPSRPIVRAEMGPVYCEWCHARPCVCEAGAQPYGCYQCGSQHNTHPPIVLRRGKLTSLLFCSPGCRSAYQPPSPAPVPASEPT
jgi:ribosomal protein S27AE